MPPDRTSTSAVQASALTRCHPDCSAGCSRLSSRSLQEHERHARTTDAKDKGPRALQSYGRCLAALYNEERQHQGLGYRTPRQIYQEGLWICGRSASPTSCASPASRANSESGEMLAFAHIPTSTTASKGIDINDSERELMAPAVALIAIGDDGEIGRATP